MLDQLTILRLIDQSAKFVILTNVVYEVSETYEIGQKTLMK